MTRNTPRDLAWFEAFYRSTQPLVYRYVWRRAPHVVDDVTSEVFITAWRRVHDIPDHQVPWLYNVAANKLAHHRRDCAKRAKLDEKLIVQGHTEPSGTDPTSHHTNRLAAGDEVAKVLGALSESDADLLRLWAWEHLEPSDIAVVLGISPIAARTRLSRAKKRAAGIAKRTGTASVTTLFSA